MVNLRVIRVAAFEILKDIPAVDIPAVDIPAVDILAEDILAEDILAEDIPVEDIPAHQVHVIVPLSGFRSESERSTPS